MIKNGRFRHFNLVLYCSEIELLSMLRFYDERITRYAFIIHDKDMYLEDKYDDSGNIICKQGTLEKPHIHLIFSMYNNATCTAVKKLFSTETDKPRVEPISDMLSCYRYLTHKDDIIKYQYPNDSIFSNDLTYYESLERSGDRKDSDQKAIDIIDLIRRGVNPYVIAKRYGRDCIIHFRQYKDFVDSVSLWEVEHPKRGEPPRLVKLAENEEIAEQIPFEID